MLNTKKLLFILPDVAYSAELLPSKKPFSFSIQTCIQVNGAFIEGGVFNVTNLSKLFSKLDSDEPYQVILPDDLFTNTIVTIEDSGDAKIKAALKETTLPSLSLNQETHDIVTTVLNELRGTTRVQLSAIERETLAPLRAVSADAKVQLSEVAPLSWALKSIVSLEPSIVILQLGSNLYGSLHYIGVEKCFTAPSDKLDSIVEMVKKLKKDEPSVMTCYLVTNDLVESELKDGLKQLLPVQQMTDKTKDQEKLPAMVATIIEESARTLAISDFPVPQFTLGSATDKEVQAYSAVLATSAASSTQGDAMPNASSDDTKVAAKDESDLPKPKAVPVAVAAAAVATPPPAVSFDEEEDAKPTQSAVSFDEAEDKKTTETVVSFDEDEDEGKEEKATKPAAVSFDEEEDVKDEKAVAPAVVATAAVAAKTAPVDDSAIDLRQFAGAQSTPTDTIGITPDAKPVAAPVAPATPAAAPIKNKSRSMTRMIITALIVFIGTVAIGVGVGVLVLKYTSKPAETTPTVEVEATPTPTPEATPDTATGSAATSSATPSGSTTATSSATMTPAIAALKILVVNATDKSGYAGQIRDSLVKAGFKSVTAGNATGTYTTTNDLIYQKVPNAAALTATEQGSGLTLTSDPTAKQEDPQGAYDQVIVLNQ